MKKILVINLGWEQEPLLDRLNALDLEIYGIHYNNDYYKAPKYKDIFITDIRDLEAILEFARKIEPDAVISDECDYSYFAQALIAETFNLPGPNIVQAQVATNKLLQRQKAKEKRVLCPEFALCISTIDVKHFANKHGYPIITKPVDNRGSFGVNRIDSEHEIEAAYINALIHSHSRLVLVEEFISGELITVDGYVFQDGGCTSLAIAQKELSAKNSQVAMHIHYPANYTEDFYEQILKHNEFVNNSLGFSFGFLHTEYMIRDEQLYLIESANRGGGVFTSEIIVPAVCGADLIAAYINDVLNVRPSKKPGQIAKNYVLLKFFSFKKGKIKKISGLKKLLKHPAVLQARLAVKEGDIVADITTDANRHGFMIVAQEHLDTTSENLLELIKVDYENK